ncbi:MAG: hypothetical protein WBB73_04085 [Candidatus Aminicenantaceae bacterium]
MRALMYSCINWGYTKCHAKVSQLARWSTEGGEKELAYWPVDPEVIPYNEICRVCDNRQFEIREKRCNACESTDIQLGGSGGNGKNHSIDDALYYRCNKCDSNLVSDVKF